MCFKPGDPVSPWECSVSYFLRVTISKTSDGLMFRPCFGWHKSTEFYGNPSFLYAGVSCQTRCSSVHSLNDFCRKFLETLTYYSASQTVMVPDCLDRYDDLCDAWQFVAMKQWIVAIECLARTEPVKTTKQHRP